MAAMPSRLPMAFTWAFIMTNALKDMLGKDHLQVSTHLNTGGSAAILQQSHSHRTCLPVITFGIILHTCSQASFMARAQTMSSNCSGCGSSELALRFIRVAWAALGFNLAMMSISSCAQSL